MDNQVKCPKFNEKVLEIPLGILDKNKKGKGYLNIYNEEKVQRLESEINKRYQSLLKKSNDSGLPENFLEPICQVLLPHAIRASFLARHYQNLHTKTGNLISLLAVSTVTIITTQTFFWPENFLLSLFEIIVVTFILFLLIISRLEDCHRKWIDYRFLAELLRSGIFLYLADIKYEIVKPELVEPPAHIGFSSNPKDWMIKAFEWIVTKQKQVKKKPIDSYNFDHLKKFFLSAWICDQFLYYEKKYKNLKNKDYWLSNLEYILFLLTLAVIILHTYLEYLKSQNFFLQNILVTFAIVLPLIAATIFTIRTLNEYGRNAERYNAMKDKLYELYNKIKEDNTKSIKSLKDYLKEANEIMLHEHQDWRAIFLFHKTEPRI